MIRRRLLPPFRAALLLNLAAPLTLTACWLPPKEVIKEKAAARKAWRAQEKQREKLLRIIPKESATAVAAVQAAPRGADKGPVTIVQPAKPAPIATPTLPIVVAAATPVPAAEVDLPPVPQPPAAKAQAGKETLAPPTRQMGQLTPVEGIPNMLAMTRPSSPLAVNAPWQDGASPAQLALIDGWQAQFEADKAAAIARGGGVDIAKQGRLFDTDAAMLYGLIPPGLYDCRLVQINTAGMAWHVGKSGRCRVLLDGETRRISFITTQEVVLGDLHENDGFSSVYLGRNMVASMGGLSAADGGEVGLVQRIADTRWRIVIPIQGGGTAVVDVTRPRVAE